LQPGANAAGQGQFGAAGQPGAGFNEFNIPRDPFFTVPDVRQQLNLNEQQFNALNQAHEQARMRFEQGVNNLNPNLTEQQRMQQMLQLQNQFNQQFNPFVDTTFTDPRLRGRFNQLNLQSQGFNAFNNPMVRQQLNLTPEQQRQIRRLNAEWRLQLQRMRRAGNENNAQLTQQQFLEMQQQFQNQLNTLLTPQQQQSWTQLTGQPVAMPANWVLGNLPPSSVVPGRRGTVGGTNDGTVQGPNRTGVAHGTQNQQSQGNQGTRR
jgi:hypothetical protein